MENKQLEKMTKICKECGHAPVCGEKENWANFCKEVLVLRENSALWDKDPICDFFMSKSQPEQNEALEEKEESCYQGCNYDCEKCDKKGTLTHAERMKSLMSLLEEIESGELVHKMDEKGVSPLEVIVTLSTRPREELIKELIKGIDLGMSSEDIVIGLAKGTL